MGNTKDFPPCLRLIAVFGRHVSAIHSVWTETERLFGPIAAMSPLFDFEESEYYRSSMGSNLKKQFAVYRSWYDPADLASDKLTSNRLELEFAATRKCDEQRPINIDPGYLSLTKLVLASTKNREHRVYLRDGIYAEITLAFRNQQWQPMAWTYPDYQRDDFRVFFAEARRILAKQVLSLDRASFKQPSADEHENP